MVPEYCLPAGRARIAAFDLQMRKLRPRGQMQGYAAIRESAGFLIPCPAPRWVRDSWEPESLVLIPPLTAIA